ncbi:hypothetical protein [Blastococcus montanus]|uniref:hypothetical protein n=1 Tax=Blastococcus montanus TaxID=3144973 RepID=UPI00320AED27
MIRTTGRPGARAAKFGFVAAPFVGLAVAVLLVWQTSYSAFSSTTSNGVNNWTAGSVRLTDNDSGVAMFSADRLMPGSTGNRCIVVTSEGTVPSTVKLYGTGLTTTNGLSSYLQLTVSEGAGTATDCSDFSGAGIYTGTLAGFTATTHAAGYGTWAPTGASAASRTYRFAWTFDSAAPQSTQGGTASITFTWEAQSS